MCVLGGGGVFGGIYTVGVAIVWNCGVGGRGCWVGSSFLLVFNQALTVKCPVFDKTQIKYLNHFITLNYFWRKQQTSLARF